MSAKHLILCGDAKCSTRKHEWARAAPKLELDIDPRHGNINLRITDISKAMFANLPDEAVDLLEIAAYVYCADQATTRGGKKEFEYGRKWRRHLRFEIPVRNPDAWSGSTVAKVLERTLGFLSDDDYEFHFHPLRNPAPRDRYLEFDSGTPATTAVDDVILFSGGLDSYAGTVEQVFKNGRKVALVSHRSVSKIDKRQRVLVEDINKAIDDPQKRRSMFPSGSTRTRSSERNTRSVAGPSCTHASGQLWQGCSGWMPSNSSRTAS